MAFIALKMLDGPGGVKRLPGDVVPEATKWKNPQPWISRNFVKWVPDNEVTDARWANYEAFAGSARRIVSAAPPKLELSADLDAPEEHKTDNVSKPGEPEQVKRKRGRPRIER